MKVSSLIFSAILRHSKRTGGAFAATSRRDVAGVAEVGVLGLAAVSRNDGKMQLTPHLSDLPGLHIRIRLLLLRAAL
jgi:hypothetical protein